MPRTKRRSLHGLAEIATCTEGSASVEGVMVVFFLALVFGMVIWAYAGHRNAMQVGKDVRQDAWERAVPGCAGGSSAEVTRDWPPYEATSRWIDAEITEHMDEVRDQEVRIGAARTATRPAVVGGGTASFEDTASLSCNTMPWAQAFDIETPAHRLFCEIHPGETFADEDHLMNWPAGCDPSVTW